MFTRREVPPSVTVQTPLTAFQQETKAHFLPYKSPKREYTLPTCNATSKNVKQQLNK